MATALAQAPTAEWQNDSFDWVSPGALAGRRGWTLADAGAGSADVLSVLPECNVLRVDPRPGRRVAMLKEIVPQGSGRHRLRFRFRLRGVAEGTLARIELKPAAFHPAATLAFDLGKRVVARGANGAAVVLSERPASDRWYSISAQIDLGKASASLFLDGQERGTLALAFSSIGALAVTGWDRAGSLELSDIHGWREQAPRALPAARHRISFGYYQVEGRWGDYRSQVAAETNAHLADPTAYPNADAGMAAWAAPLHESLLAAVRSGRAIRLSLQQQRCVADQERCPFDLDDLLDVAAPFWDFVEAVELADEPGWDLDETEARLQDFKSRVWGRGWGLPPVGIVFAHESFAFGDSFLAGGLDWVGIEAYVDPPGSDSAELNVETMIGDVLKATFRVPPARNIVLVMQGYDRNGGWRQAATLTALQAPVYELARADPRVTGIQVFSYGRCGGTHAYPSLEAEHVAVGAAISRWNRSPTVKLTSPTAGARLSEGASVTLRADAADADGVVRRVDYYANQAWIASSQTAPFRAAWRPARPGVYAVFARAWDDRGVAAVSDVAAVSVGEPPAVAIDILDAEAQERDEAVARLRFKLALSVPAPAPVTVGYSTTDESAIAGRDYESVAGKLRIPEGASFGVVEVPILANRIAQAPRTLALTLSSPVNAVLVRDRATGTILDDDPALLAIGDGAAPRGAASSLAFRVTLSIRSDETVTVSYATSDGTAVAGLDYEAVSGSLDFPPGRTNHSIAVPVIGSATATGSRVLHLELSGAKNAAIGKAHGVGTILEQPAVAELPMYRAYNPNAFYHFFTTAYPEFAHAVAAGYRDESVGGAPFKVPNLRGPGKASLHRVYNPNNGRHYYTANSAERDILMGIGWVYEKDEGFVYAGQEPATVEVFKLYNNISGVHLYTVRPEEKDAILQQFPGIWFQHTSLGFAVP